MHAMASCCMEMQADMEPPAVTTPRTSAFNGCVLEVPKNPVQPSQCYVIAESQPGHRANLTMRSRVSRLVVYMFKTKVPVCQLMTSG